jgi:hypothetical protein
MILRTIDKNDTTTPVSYVCFHPIAASALERGETVNEFTGEKYEPSCLAIEVEKGETLHEICVALGWQGGTIHQALDEIKKLKKQAAEHQGVTKND